VRRALLALGLLALLAAAADARPWGWLGVRIRDMSEQEMEEISKRHGLREGFGVVIVEVLKDTPAARAGIRNGDIVVAFEGRPVTETRLLQRLIAAAPLDAETRLTVLRQDGRRQVAVRLATMPPEVLADRIAAEFGFVLRDAPLPVDRSEAGVAATVPTVGAVLRGSAAEKAGLEVGDVLISVGARDVLSREAVREVLAGVPLDRPLPVTVRRGDRRLPLTLPAP
jgi:serine protease Do